MIKLLLPLFCLTILYGCSTKEITPQGYHPLSAAELNEEENFELCPDQAYSSCNHQFVLKKIGNTVINGDPAPTPTLKINLETDSISGYAHPYYYSAFMVKNGRKIKFKLIEFHKGKELSSYSITPQFQKMIETTRSYKLDGDNLYLFDAAGKELAEFISKSQSKLEYEWEGYCNALRSDSEGIIEKFQNGLTLGQAKSKMRTDQAINREFANNLFQKVSSTPFEEWEQIPDELADECMLGFLPPDIKMIPAFDREKNTLKNKLID